MNQPRDLHNLPASGLALSLGENTHNNGKLNNTLSYIFYRNQKQERWAEGKDRCQRATTNWKIRMD